MAAQNSNAALAAAANLGPKIAPKPPPGTVAIHADSLAVRQQQQQPPQVHVPNPAAAQQPPRRKKAAKLPKWSPEEWEARREDIYRLYIERALPLVEVIEIMAKYHRFEATYAIHPAPHWHGNSLVRLS